MKTFPGMNIIFKSIPHCLPAKLISIPQNGSTSNRVLRPNEPDRLKKKSTSLTPSITFQGKLDQNVKEMNKLQTDIQTLTNEKMQMGHYVRELEQKNDDLERAERVISESVAAIESSLNLTIERNAILESEIDEKEMLKVKLQRLVDETRDLKQELLIKERVPDNERVVNGHCQAIDSNRLRVEMETQTSPLKRDIQMDYTGGGEAGTRPARVMALNLVNEILRRIGVSFVIVLCTVRSFIVFNCSSAENECMISLFRAGTKPTRIRM